MKLDYILLTCVMLITLTGCLEESIENHPKQNVVVEEYKERNDVVSAAGNIGRPLYTSIINRLNSQIA